MPTETKISKSSNSVIAKEILILKLIVLVAVLIIPVAFMFIDMSRGIIIRHKISQLDNINGTGGSKSLKNDFVAAIPPSSIGDISQVSQEKIDSLFNNLK